MSALARLPHDPGERPDTYMAARVVNEGPRRDRQCITKDGRPKVGYRSERIARAALRTKVGKHYRRAPDYGDLNVYKCQHCLSWHTGHSTK